MRQASSARETASGSSHSATTSRPAWRQTKSAASASKQRISNEPKAGVLFLKQNHVRFNAPSKSESVFFDECNREIICLKNGIQIPGDTKLKTRVVFQSTDHQDPVKIEFLLPIEKRILSIKFNSTRTVLAYHVERNIIEFFNVRETTDPDGQSKFSLEDKKYVQASRAKNSKLIGFLWTGPMELVIITDLSVEYYHVDANRRRLKHIKLFQSTTNWFVYQPPVATNNRVVDILDEPQEDPYSILMVSTGSLGNSMQPYMFSRGQVTRLQRFEVEGNWHDNEKLELFERSITIAHLYGHVRLLVLQHESLNIKSRGAQIVLYTVEPESGTTSKTHTLDLDVNGRFAINVLDNLVIAHNQPSKSSFIFDIAIESTEKSDYARHFVSLIDSRPIRQLKLTTSDNAESTDVNKVDMYSLNWVFFQPNFIVDAKLGLLSTLEIDLPAMQDALQDNPLLLSFLAHRSDSEDVILKKCKQIVADSYEKAVKSQQLQVNPLAEVSSAFEVLGKLAVSALELEPRKPSSGEPVVTSNRRSSSLSRLGSSSVPTGQIVNKEPQHEKDIYGVSLYQEDIQREVFRWFESETHEQPACLHFITSTLLEFIFVIRRSNKNVEFCIYEQLLKCLMNGRRYFQIVQMIRSEIFKDSKQLACLLLSMRSQYRPAAQLGLDMFQRLDCLTGLVEVIDLNSDSAQSSTRLEQSVELEAT